MFETFSFKHIPFPNFHTNVENFYLKMFRRLDPETRLSDMPDDHDTESPDSSAVIDDSQLSAKLPSNLHMTTKTTNIGEQLLKRKLDHITHENCSAEDHTKQPQQKLAQLEVCTAPAATPFVSFFKLYKKFTALRFSRFVERYRKVPFRSKIWSTETPGKT